uniref:Uncharacterized protein n=1 Tax=Siphoviridae sp. ctGyV19 TaxID=2826225 RepID=A0A8S5MVB9_9CAUD|nr:MAG TPA: hypothetical protein [Siphoviridae sp. ctGyV19]
MLYHISHIVSILILQSVSFHFTKYTFCDIMTSWRK